jgi:hypothetical protein
MLWFAAIGAALIAVVLWDAFETIILPRRVTRRFRLTRFFYRSTWIPWSHAARLMPGRSRENYLSFFGPLSLILLLVVWALGLILGFGLLHWGTESQLSGGTPQNLSTYLYVSGETFFTLGYGDIIATSSLGRALAVMEAGMGFGFLAIVVGYLPMLYQSFSRREVTISLLDARAGSPPTAAELLRRHAQDGGMESLRELLHEWERWSAELMESHLSYPVLSYFRSQHDNQSWLGALTAVLDTSALVMMGLEGACERQAELTFAIARHAVVDLAQIFRASPRPMAHDRLPPDELARLRADLRQRGLRLREGAEADHRLAELRAMYEPYVNSLASYLCIELPPWIRVQKKKDNWQTTAWGGREAGD